MKLSILAQGLYGAVIVSALSLPVPRSAPLLRPADISTSLSFKKTPIDQAKSRIDAANAAFAATLKNLTDSLTTRESANAEAASKVRRAGSCTAPEVRVEWRRMSSNDQASFISAVKCLQSKPQSGAFPGAQSRYEDIVVAHQQLVNQIHMVAQFLPWHRMYLNIYEQILREECGMTVPLPWWDETLDAGNFENSPIFQDGSFSPATTSLACVSSGSFAGLTCHIGFGTSDNAHCLSRQVDEQDTSQCSTDYVNTCLGSSTYSSFEQCNEEGPHAFGHNGIGSVMSEVAASPSDPVFFLHHGFVDRMWVAWQNGDIPNRLYQVNGPTSSDGSGQLTTSFVLTSNGLKDDITVNDVMDTQGGYLCYVYDG